MISSTSTSKIRNMSPMSTLGLALAAAWVSASPLAEPLLDRAITKLTNQARLGDLLGPLAKRRRQIAYAILTGEIASHCERLAVNQIGALADHLDAAAGTDLIGQHEGRLIANLIAATRASEPAELMITTEAAELARDVIGGTDPEIEQLTPAASQALTKLAAALELTRTIAIAANALGELMIAEGDRA